MLRETYSCSFLLKTQCSDLLNFSSTGKGPFLTCKEKKKNKIKQNKRGHRSTLLAGWKRCGCVCVFGGGGRGKWGEGHRKL